MYRIPLAGLILACSMTAMTAQADTIRPLKDSKSDIAGAIFLRKDAVKSNEGGGTTTDVVTFTSNDAAFQTGVFKSGPFHEVTKGPPGYPYNEFMYFISGSVTLTSSDGSVMVVKAGEAVTLPRGWTGHFDTQGYTKMYVTYNPDDIKK